MRPWCSTTGVRGAPPAVGVGGTPSRRGGLDRRFDLGSAGAGVRADPAKRVGYLENWVIELLPLVGAYADARLEQHVWPADHGLSDHRIALARTVIAYLEREL
jgi:hypothetical protein